MNALVTADIRVVPAKEASCEDLLAVFGDRGSPAECFCQRYKLQPRRPGKRRVVMRIDF